MQLARSAAKRRKVGEVDATAMSEPAPPAMEDAAIASAKEDQHEDGAQDQQATASRQQQHQVVQKGPRRARREPRMTPRPASRRTRAEPPAQ
eukprot:752697-Pyramimonas_sp.AAC.1